MARRVHDLTIDNLDDLPEPCRSCVFWEVGRSSADDRGRAAKEAWWQATQLEWGAPGKAFYVDGALTAYGLFAPSRHLGGMPAPATPSDDAVLLATLYTVKKFRNTGAAKALLQAILREAQSRGAKAVEAFGRRGAPPEQPACVIQEEFLLAMGFSIMADHPLFPLLRLDLRQTARWQDSVESAVESVVAALSRRERAPARPAQGS